MEKNLDCRSYVLTGPTGTCATIQPYPGIYLHDHLKKAMETDAFKSVAARGNFEVVYMDGPTFGKTMQGMLNAIASALKK